MSQFTRRDVLKSAAIAGAAGAGFGFATGASAAAPTEKGPGAGTASPNDVIRVACIGVRGRGMAHVDEYAKMKGVEIAAVVDCDSSVLEKAAAAAEAKGGKRPAMLTDLRKVMEDKSIHAVSIATPNHWHSLAGLWAVQSGKDAYVEKPISHNVFEGRVLAEAAKKAGRIVQHGTQRRSSGALRAAAEFIAAGKLGKVTASVGLCYKPRGTIGKTAAPGAVPATVDYDLWLGPAAKTAPARSKFHYDWHWFWDYGNGDIGNQGVHQMDVARWLVGKNELPRGVVSLGGRFGYVDDGQTPNTQLSLLDYGDVKVVFEVRGLKTAGIEDDVKIGNIVYGSEGTLTVEGKNGIVAWMGKSREKVKIPAATGPSKPGGGQFGNFIAAMRSRKSEDLVSDAWHGHWSSCMGHLCNISYRLGKDVDFDAKSGTFSDDADKTARTMQEQMLAHLSDNGVKLSGSQYRLGRALKFDTAAEKFVGDAEADKLLTRDYREGFVVSAKG